LGWGRKNRTNKKKKKQLRSLLLRRGPENQGESSQRVRKAKLMEPAAGLCLCGGGRKGLPDGRRRFITRAHQEQKKKKKGIGPRADNVKRLETREKLRHDLKGRMTPRNGAVEGAKKR